jgi:hypothetical protein
MRHKDGPKMSRQSKIWKAEYKIGKVTICPISALFSSMIFSPSPSLTSIGNTMYFSSRRSYFAVRRQHLPLKVASAVERIILFLRSRMAYMRLLRHP